jgi:hypothetical protein
MVQIVKVRDGWLALGRSPRLAGYGATKEEAHADYARLKAIFDRCLERGRINRPGRIVRSARSVLSAPER